MDGLVIIDFQTFLLMVVGIFGLVGFVRGWWKEALTTGLLVILLLLLRRPDIAGSIIDQINKSIKLIATFFTARTLDPTELATAAGLVEPPVVIDPGTFQVYIVLLIVLVIASYFIGNAGIGESVITPIARLFGGILGLINGFIILSLVREYVLRRFLPESGVSAAAAMPSDITITISEVPTASIMDGFTAWAVIVAGALVLMLALGTRYQYDKGQLKKRTPLGYK